MPIDARFAIVTTRKKNFPTKGFLYQIPEKCESFSKFSEIVFP